MASQPKLLVHGTDYKTIPENNVGYTKGNHVTSSKNNLLIEDSLTLSEAFENSEQFDLYPERWRVLFAFSTLTCINSWIWITWSPIAPALTSYWKVTQSLVDGLSTVYMYAYIPLSFPALYLLHKYHLRTGVTVGAILNFVGSIFRCFGLENFRWVYFGTLICAIAQTLTLAIPPLLSGIWFGSKERGLATSLGVLANQLGTAMGLGFTIFCKLTNEDNIDDTHAATDNFSQGHLFIHRENLKLYIWLQMILSGISLCLILLWIRKDRPPSPPSEAAALLAMKLSPLEEEVMHSHDNDGLMMQNDSDNFSTPGYIASIKIYFKTLSGVLLFLIYGLVVGVFYAIATFLAQFFVTSNNNSSLGPSSDWSEEEAGYLGLILVLVGLCGSIISGEILDKTKAYRSVTMSFLLGSTVSMLLFLTVVEYFKGIRTLVFIVTASLGFFLTGFISIGFEYGTAISYPADEAAIAGLLNVAAQIGGWMLISIGEIFREKGLKLNEIFVSTLLISLLLFRFGVSAKSKRPG